MSRSSPVRKFGAELGLVARLAIIFDWYKVTALAATVNVS